VPVTVDHIARALINWCDFEASNFQKQRNNKGGWEGWAHQQFVNYLKVNEHEVHVNQQQPVYKSSDSDSIDLIFNPLADNPKDRIMAELTCESNENRENFEEYVSKNIEKLSNENLKTDFQETTRFIISIYFNNEIRNKLRNKEFIEVFNNLEIGCALKRVK